MYSNRVTIYFRNPDRYLDAVTMTEIKHFSWDYGRVLKRGIDVLKWGKLFLGNKPNWEMLIVAREGVAVVNAETRDREKPVAVYPTWHISDGLDMLERYCKKPVGEDMKLCFDDEIPQQFRPVWKQPHKVVIFAPPDIRNKTGGAELGRIMSIKKKYPEVEFIVHDTASYRIMFSSGLHHATFDPYQTARKGSIILPSGYANHRNEWQRNSKWIHMLGFNIPALDGDDALLDRLLYNIESVHWASENFNKNVEFFIRATEGLSNKSKRGKYEIAESKEAWLTSARMRTRLVLGPDDGYVCDDCSIATKCKFFREGMVCGVAKGKTGELTKAFKTRDAGVIIDGLTKLTGIMAERVEADLEDEEESGERRLETDRRIKDLMESGIKVAKLINPNLNGRGVEVNIGVLGQANVVAQQTPQQLMANAVRALEEQGVPRNEITPNMIRGLLEGVNNQALVEKTVEAEAIEVHGEVR